MLCEDSGLAETLKGLLGDKNLESKAVSTNGVDDLRFVLLTSRVTMVSNLEEVVAKCPSYHVGAKESESGISVGICKAEGKKCDRCWFYSESVGDDHDHPEVCPRCADAVKVDGYSV